MNRTIQQTYQQAPYGHLVQQILIHHPANNGATQTTGDMLGRNITKYHLRICNKRCYN